MCWLLTNIVTRLLAISSSKIVHILENFCFENFGKILKISKFERLTRNHGQNRGSHSSALKREKKTRAKDACSEKCSRIYKISGILNLQQIHVSRKPTQHKFCFLPSPSGSHLLELCETKRRYSRSVKKKFGAKKCFDFMKLFMVVQE
jgi:hypothetical protein